MKLKQFLERINNICFNSPKWAELLLNNTFSKDYDYYSVTPSTLYLVRHYEESIEELDGTIYKDKYPIKEIIRIVTTNNKIIFNQYQSFETIRSIKKFSKHTNITIDNVNNLECYCSIHTQLSYLPFLNARVNYRMTENSLEETFDNDGHILKSISRKAIKNIDPNSKNRRKEYKKLKRVLELLDNQYVLETTEYEDSTNQKETDTNIYENLDKGNYSFNLRYPCVDKAIRNIMIPKYIQKKRP